MRETASNDATATKVITTETVTVFVGILLALILEATLDAFCANLPGYASLTQLLHAWMSDPARSVLLTFQLLVFLFTVMRFYWGTVRYHEEVPEVNGTPHFFIGLVGAVVVFSVFYVTALVVKHTGLFYSAFCGVFLIDFIWFLIAGAVVEMPSQIQKIWSWYKLFDVSTILALGVFMACGYAWPNGEYLWSGLSLAAVAGIGIWDLRKFWRYYTKKRDWEKTLPEKVGR